MLLNNSECWQEVSDKTIKELDNLHLMFLRCILAVGSGCPIPSLFWESGSIRMKYMILQRKLIFLHHVATLPETALARQVYEVQTRLTLPGLVDECQEFLIYFGITQMDKFSKNQWKTMIKKHIRKLNKDKILTDMGRYKKLNNEQLINEEFEHKQYLSSLNISSARLMFRIKSLMTPTIRMNFQSDAKFTLDLWACPGCPTENDKVGYRDTQFHVTICPGYAHIRQDKNLTQDKDIVQYFHSNKSSI